MELNVTLPTERKADCSFCNADAATLCVVCGESMCSEHTHTGGDDGAVRCPDCCRGRCGND